MRAYLPPNDLKMINEEFKDKVLELSVSGIYVYDLLLGLNIYINQQYTNLTGYTIDDINQMSKEAFFSLFHPDEQQEISQHMEEVVASDPDQVIEIEYRFKKADGCWMWCLSRDAVFERDVNGETTKFIGTFVDITEKKLLEKKLEDFNKRLEKKVNKRSKELERKNQELRAINDELESFSYSVSHDLRAPLRAVSGYAEALSEDYSSRLGDEAERFIQLIKFNAAKMGNLIDDLLSFSRLGRQKMKKTQINMQSLVKELTREIEKTTVHNAKIKIGKLHKVYGDSNLLHQVMQNLISNGIKFSSKKTRPVVQISCEDNNDEVIFTVKDNGAGFNMEYVDKLFGVFQRLHSDDEFEGTGVGLAIVQRIISKHGGRVWAKGEPEKGAIFRFSLAKS